MSLKKSLIVPAALLAALTVGSLTACVSQTTSDVKTTSSSAAGGGLNLEWGKNQTISGLPTEIPYLTQYSNAHATGDEAKGTFELTINGSSKDAQADASKKLTEAGFTAADEDTFTSSKWTVDLSGTGGTVVYKINKK
ncbi:hypothetical protein [Leifsonia xyli]|uniref:hypothetical protein n=1 Tax=Leifsonia xyli TaxID=1575 RepID=UPI003D67C1DF